MPCQELILIRGLPGSGKSTIARSLTLYEHFEADTFFLDDEGEYRYDHSKIAEAHKWCQHQTLKALTEGKDVVVSNTFVRIWEMLPYKEMAKTLNVRLTIIEATGKWSNTHGVTPQVIERMRNNWEIIPENFNG